ncbi:polysaccharide biosynthesis/export family protein [Ferruginibacter profundus]
MGTRFLLFASVICLMFCASCTTPNKIAYFQNAKDTTYRQALGTIDAPFQKNDLLEIAITSRSKDASADYNKSEPKGYLVSKEGNIEIPMLGSIKAEGLTKKELKDKITKIILDKQVLVDPQVEIRYLNFEVTVLGEVSHPTVINVPSEQITLVKALGLAGDMTIYGKRDNVLLVREEDGVRKTRRINLNSSDFLNSEYYYLKPNDLIYVEPNKTKVAVNGRGQQAIPLIFSSISILFLVFDKIIK